jgi:glutamate racemase
MITGMNSVVRIFSGIVFALLIYLTVVPESASSQQLAGKDSVTILITDSGLGGLAVCADIERRLNTEHPFRFVQLIFCNALPESDYGYNTMASREEKIRIFSAALTGMTKWYSPDIILIACNTLSVLYNVTPYAKTTKVPVISIVEIGVDMMAERLRVDPSASMIIFGTETTIGEDVHKQMLLKSGFSEERIRTQACPDLAGEIQSDAASDAVQTMIAFYSDDAVQKLSQGSGTVIAGLCCTHYGFAEGFFRDALMKSSGRTVTIVDPTTRMSDVVFSRAAGNRFSGTAIDAAVVSRAQITPAEIQSIGRLLEKQSPRTTRALQKYEMKRNLFELR